MTLKSLGESLLEVRYLQSQSISPLYLIATKKKKVPLQWRNLWETTLPKNLNITSNGTNRYQVLPDVIL